MVPTLVENFKFFCALVFYILQWSILYLLIFDRRHYHQNFCNGSSVHIYCSLQRNISQRYLCNFNSIIYFISIDEGNFTIIKGASWKVCLNGTTTKFNNLHQFSTFVAMHLPDSWLFLKGFFFRMLQKTLLFKNKFPSPVVL